MTDKIAIIDEAWTPIEDPRAKFKWFTIRKMEREPGHRTDTFEVWTSNELKPLVRSFLLGTIRWHPPWRQYCFFPESSTVFSTGCMEDLISFVKELNEERMSSQ